MDEMNLDEMIAFYSDELMKLKKTDNETAQTEKKDIPQIEPENVENTRENETYIETDEFILGEETRETEEIQEDENEEQSQQETFDTAQPQSEDEPLATANFFARVFSGESAFPVLGAKVILKRNGELYKVLTTSASGETTKIKIASYKKENSLESENENQRYDYLADVYAEGFVTQKDLLVSAVGGSEIILTVQMIPVSERID